MAFLAGNSQTTWRIDSVSPFNWTDLTGKFLNTWDSITHYPGWTGYNAAAVANIRNVRLTFAKTGDVTLKQN